MDNRKSSHDSFEQTIARLRARVAAAQENAAQNSALPAARHAESAVHKAKQAAAAKTAPAFQNNSQLNDIAARLRARSITLSGDNFSSDAAATGFAQLPLGFSAQQEMYSGRSVQGENKQITQILAGLNERQHEAVVYNGGHLLVVAGAGSGKTRVLTTRISYLIASQQAEASEILAITFTNKAAKEMRERLALMLGPIANRMWISTFHSACVRILRAEHEAIGYRAAFTIYDSADSQRLMKIVCAEEGIESKQFTPKVLAHRISDLKNEMITPAKASAQAADRDEVIVAKAYAGYQRRLTAANAMDFDDLIFKTVQLLQTNKLILDKYQRRFRHILVDEYQDTNPAQYELIRILAGEHTSEKHAQLTVVGDADQSIYAFRGATIRNIESFESDFPSTHTVLLEQNYRSTQNILSAANALIANNSGRRAKNLWTDLGAGEKLIGYVADSEREEASFIVDEIDQLRREGFKYGDFAIFYRANAQSRTLEDLLMRAGIPYKVVGGTKFYDRKEIKDAIAYLQSVANPDDTVSLRRIFNEPKRGLGAKAEGIIAAHAELYGISFGAALADLANPETSAAPALSPRAQKSVREFLNLLHTAREKAQAGEQPAEILDYLMDESKYLQVLQVSNDPQDEVRVENLAELRSVAADFSNENPQGTLDDFLDQVSLVSDTDQLSESENHEGEVVLMTVHTAKGLEFPVVFVTGLEDGTFPHIRSINSLQELAEERRLAYVALTRARQRLYLTRAACRTQWGAAQELPQSRFLEEIPSEVIEWRKIAPTNSGYGSGYGFGYSDSANKKANTAYRNSWHSWDEDDFAPAFGSGTGINSKPFKAGKLGVEETSAKSSATDSWSAHPASAMHETEKLDRQNSENSAGAVKPNLIDGLKIGDRIRHKTFGIGKVIDIEGSGKSCVVKVRFNSGNTTRLMLRFAPLEKLS